MSWKRITNDQDEQVDAYKKIRKDWGDVDPRTRVVPDKKKKYDRKKQKERDRRSDYED